MPRVRVIMPAFNAEANIGEALQAIETYVGLEIVIGDDGTD
jgi:glycosyltransferase involved in cell wall biosynthesis